MFTPEQKELNKMNKDRPLIVSIVGKSDSGKTTLILKLLPELKRRGKRIAVAKHCPCGFDLDVKGKDSWKFTQAGGEGTFLSSQETIALLRPREGLSNLKERLQNYFSDFDLVLMEGYNNEAGINKIQIIRSGIGEVDSPLDEIIAYISDMSLDKDKPVYHPDDISAIASFIETLKDQEKR